LITVHNLEKSYGQGLSITRALKGVNLAIRSGEFVAIMGRSGAGKSTMLHLLGLLDRPTKGEIFIDNTDVLELSKKERARFRLEKLGYVFQENSLLGELTVLENVYLPALCSTRQSHYKKRAEEILDLVGLEHRLTHYPDEISGGEQQRVAIARALINKPGILFADEPTASLDMASAKVVLELFRRLNKELHQTIVMVTHEPDDAKYVDRGIQMEDGVII